MPTCPAGHDSVNKDFCDTCGMRIAGASPQVTPPAMTARPCPSCGTARSGRFCESCGFDFDSGAAPATSRPVAPGGAQAAPAAADPAAQPGSEPGPAGRPPAWTAVVASDHAYYQDMVAAGTPDAAAIQFPGYCPERRFQLTGQEMRIGRRSESRGLHPEIDLTGPPTDPGISRLQAVLIAEPDGSWVVIDPGSENGTLVNGSEIAAGTRIALRNGDRIHVGAWTVITIRAS